MDPHQSSFRDDTQAHPSSSNVAHHDALTASSASATAAGSARSSESKPRLNKEAQEFLENCFSHQPKPSTAIKKDLAQRLHVSLDKVNNWFQNRRAKVKQDAKKLQTQGVYHAYLHNMSYDPRFPPTDSSFIDPSFYNSIGPSLAPPPTFHPAGMQVTPQVLEAFHHHQQQQQQQQQQQHQQVQQQQHQHQHQHQQQHQHQHQHQHQQQHQQTQPFAQMSTGAEQPLYDSAMQSRPDNFVSDQSYGFGDGQNFAPNVQPHTLEAPSDQPSANLEPIFDFDPAMTSFFGLPGAVPASESTDFASIQTFAKQFNNPQETFDQHYGPIPDFDGNTSGSASLFTRVSHDSHFTNDDIASRFHGSARQPSSSVNSMNTGMGRTSMSPTGWTGMQMVDPHTENDSNGMAMRAHGMPHHFARHQTNQKIPEEPAPNFDTIHPSFETQPSHLAIEEEDESLSPHSLSLELGLSKTAPSSTPSFAYASEDSSHKHRAMSNHSGSTFDTPPPPTNIQVFKQSSSASNLAERRQKRPAALGTAALRSASYSSGAPASPGTAVSLNAPEPSLRRIKSSIGVMTGRVQKSGASSAQRSPAHFSFAEAAQSPRFQRHYSTASCATHDNEEPRGLQDKAPPTPLSPQPNNLQVPPSSASIRTFASGPSIDLPESTLEANDSLWANMPNTAGTTASTAYSYMPNTGDSMRSYASPPTTPMDLHNQRLRNGSVPHFIPPIPQSAPAWQQSFQFPFSADTSSMPPPVTPLQSAMTYRPSTSGQDSMSMMQTTRRPSHSQTPGGLLVPVQGNPFLQPSQDTSNDFSPQQYNFDSGMMASNMPQMMQVPQNYHTPDMANGGPAITPTRSGPEREFYAWTPREPADPSALPPKSTRLYSSQITFANQFSNTFNSP